MLDALILSISRDFKAESEWNCVKCILLLLVIKTFEIFEELILGRDLMMMLKMIHHLPEVVAQAIEVDLPTDWAPSKVEM